MEVRRNTVTMDLSEYRKLIEEIADVKHQYTELLKKHCEILQARYEVLPEFIEEYNMQHFKLEANTKLTDEIRCGLKNVDKLIGLFEPAELIEYIAIKKEEYKDGTKEA